MEASPAMQAALVAAAELAKTGVLTLGMAAAHSPASAPQALKRDYISDHHHHPLHPPPPHHRHNDTSPSSFSDTDDADCGGNAEEKLARNRERNREHARRTRLRKKAQLEDLQEQLRGLEEEGRGLRTRLEECSVAGILLGLSSGQVSQATEVLLEATKVDQRLPRVSLTAGGKRKRFISEDFVEKNPPQPLKVTIDGQVTAIGGAETKTHINWKSGVFCDERGVEKQLSREQLEKLRRERNRMHAKMTRERKKGFISAIKKNIYELEKQNKKMRQCLDSFRTTDQLQQHQQRQQHHLKTPASEHLRRMVVVSPYPSPPMLLGPPALPLPPPNNNNNNNSRGVAATRREHEVLAYSIQEQLAKTAMLPPY